MNNTVVFLPYTMVETVGEKKKKKKKKKIHHTVKDFFA